MKQTRLATWLARVAIVAVFFGAAFAVGNATERLEPAGAVAVRTAPPAASPGVTGLGPVDPIPRLLPTPTESPSEPTVSDPASPSPTPSYPPSGSPPGGGAPNPGLTPPGPSPPNPGPDGGDDESQSGSL